MSYHTRPGNGPPTWFVFILSVAFIFGGYYLWIGLRDYVASGGLSVSQATEQSAAAVSITEERLAGLQAKVPTRRPSSTARPPCQDFEVIVESGIVRRQPTTAAPQLEILSQGTIVCVLESVETSDAVLWYLVDTDSMTRFIEAGYMREDIIRSLSPTPTATNTGLALPTITNTYTPLPSHTPVPENVPDENATPTHSPPTKIPSPTASPTPASVST